MWSRRLGQLGIATSVSRSLAVAAAAIMATASCASSVTTQSADSSASGSATASSVSRTVPVDRLTVTVTYQSGHERFDPLPRSYQPKISATQAFEAFARSGDPRTLGTEEKPTILLASYTNFVAGKHATLVTGTMDPIAAGKSDEASRPWWTAVPVWYIRYLQVPVVSNGAPVAPGRNGEPPETVVQEMVIPVSAETGQVLMMESGRADRTATSWAAPTSGGGDADKSLSFNAQQATTSPPTATRTH